MARDDVLYFGGAFFGAGVALVGEATAPVNHKLVVGIIMALIGLALTFRAVRKLP